MSDLNLREWAAVIPLIAMMVWMGVYSQSFLPPVGKTTARVLEQTQINVPVRASAISAASTRNGGAARAR